jgi:transcriptional regulator with XRE-family HTH domain
MRSKLAQTIRNARRTAGLTQQQLGMRLGLTGRAVSRWERSDSAPTQRHRAALVMAIKAVDVSAAASLAAALSGETVVDPASAPVRSQPAVDAASALEHAIYAMADELDLPARRIRGALARLLQRLRRTDMSLETTERLLESWINTAP